MSIVVRKTDFGPHGFRWLTLKRIEYEDPNGRLRYWESAERLSRHGDVDGVAIITLVRSKQEPLKVILESQFRPSQGNTVIELPAGLIDAGESAADAAVRELKEETGYTGRVTEVSPVCYSDPGMSNANMQFAVLDVDADAPENADINPELEEGEFIDVFLLPFDGLYDALLEKQRETGWDVDARLMMYADAIKRAAMIAFAPQGTPAGSAAATASSAAHQPGHHEDIGTGLPKLHIKTRAEPHGSSASAARSGAGNSADVAAHITAEDADKAAHSCQEGFIEADPSPAVLKTEFPAKLEPVTERPPTKMAYDMDDACEGEILLENEAAPGRSSDDICRQPDSAAAPDSRHPAKSNGGSLDLERRTSIDLAAGLNRSPRRMAPGGGEDLDDDVDIRPGLFPPFRMAPPPSGSQNGHQNGCEEMFASPFKRQGSLIALERVPSVVSAPNGTASDADQSVVYCPVDVTPGGEPSEICAPETAGRPEAVQNAGSAPAGALGKKGLVNLLPELVRPKGAGKAQGATFALGVVVGAAAGVLLAYLGAMHRVSA